MFLNISVLQGRVVSTLSNPQAGGPPLVGCPRLLIQFIRSCPPYRRPFLYLQPEDAPCRGDRDPLHGNICLIMTHFNLSGNILVFKIVLQIYVSGDIMYGALHFSIRAEISSYPLVFFDFKDLIIFSAS